MSIHVTTFYSFKGGVGRTQALVNAAAWIASSEPPALGSRPRVVMVDFDLEASGIQFVEGLEVLDSKPGIVDFIHDYLDHAGEVPNIANYISQASLPNGVQVDVILAGDHARYYRRFGQLRFDALWQRQHGSDLFLDMRNQLSELGYEFMLVDSRTGLCDTSELCTLTLPDQVVVVFAPNRQNLAGTKLVIERIRQNPLVNVIGVASRVRKTDDEHGGLRSVMSAFREIFSDARMLVVHEDPQQRVLADAVAVVSYRRSALAKEYRRIARRIVARNTTSARWVQRVIAGAPTAKRMDLRFGISGSSLGAWRAAVRKSLSADSETIWALAMSHSDAASVEARVLGVSVVPAMMSVAVKPSIDAVRWLVAGLEHGQLSSIVSDFESDLGRIVHDAIVNSLSQPGLMSCRDDALAFLVWTATMHEQLGIPGVHDALHAAASYAAGGCFGGFLGVSATDYILRCGDKAGVDWRKVGSFENARPWIRSAALRAGRMDLFIDLREPTSLEVRSVVDWIRWASDMLGCFAGASPTEQQRIVAHIRDFVPMLESLRAFWLPGVLIEAFNVVDNDYPEKTWQVEIEPYGMRPQGGSALGIWNGHVDAPEQMCVSQFICKDDPLDYITLSWFGLIPSVVAILRAVGESDQAAILEDEAIRRLEAGADFGAITRGDPGEPYVTDPIHFGMVYSPCHGAPLSSKGLQECLRSRGVVDLSSRDHALRVKEASFTRVSWSTIGASIADTRAWHGWHSHYRRLGSRSW